MSRRSVLPRPSSLDAQLRAQALSADRANTPTTLLVVAGALVAAALIFLIFGALSLSKDRATLRDAQHDGVEINALVEEIKQFSSSELDLSAIYPEQRRLQADILSVITDLDLSFKQSPSVQTRRQTQVTREPPINEVSVVCRLNGPESLEMIFAWIDGILHRENLEGQVFMSQIQLAPDVSSSGWTGQFQVSLYEYKP